MENYNFIPISEIEKNQGRTVRIAGFVSDAAHMTTKKGSKFGKLILNDYSGNQEIVFWENNYVTYNNFIDNGQKLMIEGVYQEHRFRPGVMEFQIHRIILLDQVRKTLTKRMHLLLPLHKIDRDLVKFLHDNQKQYVGNTELILQIVDETDRMAVKLKSQSMRLEINDELTQYLQEHDEIKFSLEVA